MIRKMMPVGLKQALNKALQPFTGLQDPPKKCKRTKAGDGPGVSCLDCGTALEGYGHQTKGSKNCIHKYMSDEDNTEICIYCDGIQIK